MNRLSFLCVIGLPILCLFSGCGTDAGAPTSAALSPPLSAEFDAAEFNTESYDAVVPNDFQRTIEQPLSTFAIDVDTASYANVRRLLRQGTLPPAGAVRLEELVNYFPYSYPTPSGDHPFGVSLQTAACPWNAENRLLRVALNTQTIDLEQSLRCNLVFLIDVSGSMNQREKLPLVKSALKLLVDNLHADDRVAMVVYAGAAGVVLDSTSIQESGAILEAIERLAAGGSTNGGEGIQLAYQIAANNYIDGGVNRVVLCTDGDFNVGVTNRSDLVDLIESKAESNIFLSVLGFGSGNLKDAEMEQLADRGNGNYGYIDSLLEAQKILVEEAGGTLVAVAKDVKIQLDFNPEHIESYRLIGYENRLLQNRDFIDDEKDAGEIGMGHQVTAFYELVPRTPSSPSGSLSGPKVKSEFVTVVSKPELADTALAIKIRYKKPEGTASTEQYERLSAEQLASDDRSGDIDFAIAVLGYGFLLRNGDYTKDVTWEWVIETAEQSLGEDRNGLRREFVQLAKLAKSLQGTTRE